MIRDLLDGIGGAAWEALEALGLLAIPVAFVGGLVLLGAFDDAPGTRAGFPDPPPLCSPGEAPRRIYFVGGRGDHVMTCRLPDVTR